MVPVLECSGVALNTSRQSQVPNTWEERRKEKWEGGRLRETVAALFNAWSTIALTVVLF